MNNNRTPAENSKQEKDKKKDKDGVNIAAVSAGIVSGYASEYLENVFLNVLKGEEDIFKDNFTPEDYIVSMIQGATDGLMDDKIENFNAVVLSTGLQYALYNAFDELKGKKPEYNFIFDLFLDIFFIYLLFLVFNLFQNRDDDEGEGFAFEFAESFPFDVLVSLYYAFKEYFQKKNSNNDS